MTALELLSTLRLAKVSISLDGDKLKIKAPPGALTAELKQELKANKEALIELLQETLAEPQADLGIPKADYDLEAPLSFNQEALWTLEQKNPGTVVNNMPLAFKFTGDVREQILQDAINLVLERHEVLRTRVVENELGEPRAQFAAFDPMELQQLSIHLEPNEALLPRAHEIINELTQVPFDLQAGPLYRFYLVEVLAQPVPTRLFVACLHHLITDGLSQNILAREIALAYAALCQNQPPPFAPLALQYGDFVFWQRQQFNEAALSDEVAFWREQLAGLDPLLNLPTDRPRPPIQTTKGAKWHFTWSEDTASALMGFCGQQGVTLYMGLMTAFQALLARWSKQVRFCVGIPTAGRVVPALEPLLGLFVNGLPLPVDARHNPSWLELLARVKGCLTEVLNHQSAPIQQIINQLDIPRNPAYSPVAQVGFQLQDFSTVAGLDQSSQSPLAQFRAMTAVEMEAIPVEAADAKFDLILSLAKNQNQLSGYVEFNTDLFDQSTMELMVDNLETAIVTMVRNPEQRIDASPLVSLERLRSALGLKESDRLLPLTPTQTAFINDQQFRPDTKQYAIGINYPMSGPIQRRLMEQAVASALREFSSLGAKFYQCSLAGADEFYQVISAEPCYEFETIWLDTAAANKQQVDRHFQHWCYISQNPLTDPMTRIQLLVSDNDQHWLLIACHHIVGDGIAGAVLLERIIERYRLGLATHDQNSIPQFQDPWPDYVLTQRTCLDQKQVLDFWREKVNAVAPLSFTMPIGYRPHSEYQIQRREIASNKVETIKRLCRSLRTHPVNLYKYITALLIQSYCRPEQDFVLWDIQSGRTAETANAVGVFYQQIPNLIPLQLLGGQAKAEDFFRFQKEDRKSIRDYSALSLAAANQLFPAGNISFQFNYFNFLVEPEFNGVAVEPFLFSSHVDNVVQMFIKDQGQRLSLELRYDHRAFLDLDWLARFEAIIDQLSQQPGLTNGQLGLQLEHEQMLAKQWNTDPASNANKHSDSDDLLAGFVQSCQAQPDALAVRFGATDLTYRELDQLSNQLAHWLLSKGAGEGVRIGLCLDRSHWQVVALLAVAKVGAIYVPVDAAYPESRIHYLLTDADISIVVSERCLQHRLPEQLTHCFWIDEADTLLAECDAELTPLEINPSAPLYTIYTSGSTGNPKGATVTRAGFLNLLQWYLSHTGLTAGDRTLIISAFGFDLTQKNLLAPLLSGAAVVIPKMTTFDSQQIVAAIEANGISHINCAPSAFYSLVDSCQEQGFEALASLRWLFLGGEAIRWSRLAPWANHKSTQAKVVNSYGPTECSDVVAFHQLSGDEIDSTDIPIGKPIDHTELRVVDQNLVPVPHGLVGEIVIAGAGVGLGYLNNQQLTDQVFVNDPVTAKTWYRTGDLGRYDNAGNLHYVGRKDFQVKIRGQRIELGEIEAALNEFADIQDSLVTVVAGNLVAYATSSQAEIADWGSQLRRRLPEYMVPNQLVLLPSWPLTPNGKIDRSALPEPSQAPNINSYRAPSTEVETLLVQIWSQVLQQDEIGVDDNFFERGGHSLLANQIAARVRKLLAVELPVRDLILYPTIAQQAQRIENAKVSASLAAISRVDRQQRFPLSASQQRLWLLDQIDPGNPAYHVPLVVELRGSLNVSHLQQAFSSAINAHEGLRTYLAMDEQGPPQQFLPQGEWRLPLTDVSELTAAEIKKRVASLVVAPFDLQQGPLFRAACLKLGDDRYLLALVLHHIITDGWSNGLLLKQISAQYLALNSQLDIPPNPAAIQYADFAYWQQQVFSQQQVQQQLEYWQQQLADVPVLELPLDSPRSEPMQTQGQVIHFELGVAVSDRLIALSNQHQCTPFMTFMAIYAMLLQRYSGQDDFAIGTPVAGRQHPDVESVIGFFVNTLAIRVHPSADLSFTGLLAQVRQRVLADLEQQQLPFEQIVEVLNPERDMSRTPLFQVMLAYQNLPLGEIDGLQTEHLNLTLEPYDTGETPAKFEQTLTLWPTEQGFQGSLVINSSLFSLASGQQFVQHFVQLCDAVGCQPDQAIYQYEVLSGEERHQQVTLWQQEAANSDPSTVVDSTRVESLVAAVAQQQSDAIALHCGAQQLTYAELLQAAEKVAIALKQQGVEKGDFVGLLMDRHPLLMPALLGTLLAGAAYIPVDARYPKERINYICEQSAIRVMLTHQGVEANLETYVGSGLQLLDVANLVQSVELRDFEPPAYQTDDLIYVIYTSGSTGKPKGTGAYHRSFANLLHWYSDDLGMKPQDRLLLLSAIGFDLTQKNLLAPLVCGAQLVIPEFQEYDPQKIIAVIGQQEVTWINCAPSAFYPLIEDPEQWHLLASLTTVVLGGEPINYQRLSVWLNHSGCRLINSYGPTECADVAAYYDIPLNSVAAHSLIPIGGPIRQVQLYVLGEHQELLPPGAVGEICIAGAGLGPGYLNQPELTQQVFVNNPLSPEQKLYRTGDRGRWVVGPNTDKPQLVFLGRKDHQIKLRGYRIEAGEIEAVINDLDWVKQSLVDRWKTDQGTEQLVAWVALMEDNSSDDRPLDQALQQWCSDQLPSYMVPDLWVTMAEFPLTPNGKIDRKALPPPQWKGRQTELVAPRTALEMQLQQIWQDVLGNSEIGVYDNFFALGGHSLLVTQVVAKIYQQMAIKLPVRDMMAQPTIAATAQRIAAHEHQAEGLPLERVSRDERIPLSFAQQRLWLLDKIEGGSLAYHVPVVLRLRGSLDQSLLQQAFTHLMQRHEALRTIFPEDQEGPRQQVQSLDHWQFEKVVLSEFAEDSNLVTHGQDSDLEFELRRLVAIEVMKPFDLERDILVRAKLFTIDPQHAVLCVVIHHMVTDGWSMNILLQDLANTYGQLSQQSEAFLPPLSIQYLDFSQWQRQRLDPSAQASLLAYWQQQLAGVETLELPLDFPRPAQLTHAGDSIDFSLGANYLQSLEALARSQDVTLFALLLTNFAILLRAYSGQDDFCIGTPVAGREHPELESVVGFFVNTLAVRVKPQAQLTVVDLLQQVKSTLLAGFEHQEVPFEQVVELVNPQRDMSRAPIFQVMLSYQNYGEVTDLAANTALGNIQIEPFDSGVNASKYELNLSLWHQPDGKLGGSIQFNTDLFAHSTIENLVSHFVATAQTLAQQPDTKISALDWLSDDEKAKQLIQWNQSDVSVPQHPNLVMAIEQGLGSNPSATAVECGEAQLSCAQLSQQSNQLAHYLMAQGIASGDRVAICIPRQLHLMTVLLGTLKAGATYVPLDPSYPEERIAYILASAGAKAVITTADFLELMPASVVRLQWEQLAKELPQQDDSLPSVSIHPEQVLYYIFTSGSTGKPKGAGVTHRSALNLNYWYGHQFGMSARDKLLLVSALGFDLTQKNLFAPLMHGACLVIPEFQEYDNELLTQLIESAGVTWLNCAPSAFYPLQDAPAYWPRIQTLRWVFLGGEAIHLKRLAPWLGASKTQLINSYGPTECTDIAAWHPIRLQADLKASAIPIGKPNYNVKLYVLGHQLELLPTGAVGEICVGGAGVGVGYINNPELTAEVFVDNPYTKGERLYRTGDLGRWRESGDIEYLGRRDTQLKRRGYRVEAGEVQAVIREFPGVKDCLLDLAKQPEGSQADLEWLVAWVSVQGDSEPDPTAIKQHVRRFVPEFMVPDHVVLLAELPLTPNGKVDRRALPMPAVDNAQDHVAPETELEKQLAQIWGQVLGIEQPSVRDNFFAVGGQSLLATQFANRASTALGVVLRVRTLFEHPTIAELATALETLQQEPQRPPLVAQAGSDVWPLSYGQQRLWFFEQITPGTATNNMPVAIKLRGAFDPAVVEKAFNEIVRRHASLRTAFIQDEQGQAQQKIMPQLSLDMPITDLSQLPATERDQQLQQLLEQNNKQVFDLSQAPLLRASWVVLSTDQPQESCLLFCMHHIISDGASMVVLFRELVVLYQAFSQQQPSPLPELAIQYKDFAHWQRDWLTEERLQRQLSYWQQQLSGAPPLLELPLDYPRPPVQKNQGATLELALDANLSQEVRVFCGDQGLTPFMFFLGAWQMLLARYSGQTDILVGVPTQGRDQLALESIIGFFIQSLVIRSQFGDNPSLLECLQLVRATVLTAYQHSDAPIDSIVERLGIARNPAYTPLVQVAFQLLDEASLANLDIASASESLGLPGADLELLSSATQTAKFDLTLNVTQQQQGFSLNLEYDRNLFALGTVQQLLDCYQQLCWQIVHQSEAPINTVELVAKEQLLDHLALDRQHYVDVIPLTAMQHDMFMDNLVNPTSLQSSHGWVFELDSPQFSPDLWHQAIQVVTDQQPLLRGEFKSSELTYLDMGYLVLRAQQQVTLNRIDNRKQQKTGVEIAHELIYRPYRLESDELISHHLIEHGPTEQGHQQYTAVVAVHHALLDGSALNVFWLQLAQVYRQLTAGDAPTVNAVPFVEFARQCRKTTDTKPIQTFWRDRLARVEPLDFTLPGIPPAAGKRVQIQQVLRGDHWQGIKTYCRAQRITPALYFKCLYLLLIDNYCRPDADFLVQETFAGRTKGFAESLGCFIEEHPFVAAKDQLAATATFTDLLAYARDFQKAVKGFRPISIGRQREFSPRGRIGFMYNFYQFVSPAEFLGREQCPYSLASDPADNVQFVVTEQAGELTLSLYYHPHLFNDFAMLARIESLSQQLIFQQRNRLGDLSWVTDPTEQLRLLEQFNDTAKDYDLSCAIHQRFEQQVGRTPDSIAIADDQQALSYQALNQAANRLAHHLIALGVKSNDLVGLHVERSCWFLVGVLGIMKAGAAYVALDSKYPKDRIQYMVENSAVKVLVTEPDLLQQLSQKEHRFESVLLTSDSNSLADCPDHDPGVRVSPTDRAYMIYTSGSTGRPKGAIVRHDGALNHIEAERDALRFPGPFNFLQTAPVSSDISVWQYLGPVVCGGKVVVLDEVTNAAKLLVLVKSQQINLVELVPVALQLLMEHVRTLPAEERQLPELRWMMATGEAVSVDLVNRWLELYPGIPVVNAYGPTEAADDVIQCAIEKPLPVSLRSVPIGKPLANLRVYILDQQLRLLPSGIAGEICIGGIGVGEGYWQNPEKTAAAFVTNPFKAGETLYRTGDLGRWLPDGSVEYLDRIDHQVKIRGFRVELGEIEAAFSALDGVRENVVILDTATADEPILAAYLVPDPGARDTLSSAQVRAQLRQRLPEFMVPAAITVLAQLPLTPAGKVDRKALPSPDLYTTADGEYVAPKTALEQTLAEIWQSVLNKEKISTQANFFELGGHSILAVRIMARLNKQLNTSVSVARLLTEQTIERLALSLEQDASNSNQLLPLADNTHKDRPSMVMIHPIGGDVLCYRDLAQCFADEYNLYGIRAQGLEAGETPLDDVDQLVTEYVNLISELQLEQPCWLLGQSIGGLFALAVAQRLKQQSIPVAGVILLDTFSPNYLGTDAIASGPIMAHVWEAEASSEHSLTDKQLEALFAKGQQTGWLPVEMPFAQFLGLYRVAISNHEMALQLESLPIQLAEPGVPVLHVTARDNPTATASGDSWTSYHSAFVFREAAGGHETMMQGNLATDTAKLITDFMQGLDPC